MVINIDLGDIDLLIEFFEDLATYEPFDMAILVDAACVLFFDLGMIFK